MENKYLEISDPEKKPKEEDSEFWELLTRYFWKFNTLEAKIILS